MLNARTIFEVEEEVQADGRGKSMFALSLPLWDETC